MSAFSSQEKRKSVKIFAAPAFSADPPPLVPSSGLSSSLEALRYQRITLIASHVKVLVHGGFIKGSLFIFENRWGGIWQLLGIVQAFLPHHRPSHWHNAWPSALLSHLLTELLFLPISRLCLMCGSLCDPVEAHVNMSCYVNLLSSKIKKYSVAELVLKKIYLKRQRICNFLGGTPFVLCILYWSQQL